MFFAKQGGDFDLKNAQNRQRSNSRDSLQQNQAQKTPQSSKNNRKSSQDRLQQAGKNILDQKQQNRLDQLLSSDVQQKIYSDFAKEGGVADNLFSKKPPVFQKSPNPIQPNLSSQMSGKIPKKQYSSAATGKDSDVVGIMAQRLSKVEMLSNNQREEIKEKSIKIQQLEEQLDMYKKSDEKNFKLEYEKLKTENKELKKQIDEMEKFLLQYGLKWKGYNDGDKGKNEQEIKQLKDQLSMLTDPKFKYNLPKEIDINIILKRLDDLNYVIEKEGGTHIVKDNHGVHQFKKHEKLPIGFYSNGIVLKGFPFYPYGSNQASQILADILDGYFPYQLKKDYPNGTLLKVIDKTDEVYNPDKKFQGKFGDLNGNNENDNELKPISKDDFLNKLPKQIIKDGKVVEVRGEIAKKFDVNNDIQTKENIQKQKDYNDKISKYEHIMEDERTIIPQTPEQKKIVTKQITPEEMKQICLLKIRTESGKYIILLRLFQEKKISDVYRILSNFAETQDFQIMDNSSRKFIPRDTQENLYDLDFYPNAVLTLKQNV